MFNIGIRKVGGIWFWNVGRIGGSFHCQSRETFAAKRLAAAQAETQRSLVAVERLCFSLSHSH